MVETQKAIEILEEIKQDLDDDSTGKEALKTIDTYRKGLEIATNPTIKKLIEQQKEYFLKYGEFDKRTIKLNKKISNELSKIYNSR